ncbi:MAG TPA: ABC transporter substrate-binding protein [Candidatus Limnocylindria bacterium]|jgi:NitT/TauT family transport system substrate-binding protein
MSTRFTLAKIFSVVLVALFVAACGGSPPAASQSPGASASPSAAAGQLPKPEVTTLRIGISTPNEPVQYAEKLADTLGIYQKYGFTSVSVTGFEGDGKALQALIANQLDFMVGGASTAISSQTTDTPVTILAMNSTKLTDGLWCGANIKTAADVKGKSIAISTFGGTSHGSALLLLKGLNYTDKDATITQVGGQSARIAALKGGSVACAVVDMAEKDNMTAQGFNVLYDETKSDLQWGRSGLMTTADFLKKNPNAALVVVAATLEAQQKMFTDAETSAKTFATFAQIKDADALNAVKAFAGYGSRTMSFTEDALKLPQQVLATQNAAMGTVDLKKAYDLSLLQKLKDNGFNAKIGVPAS